MAITILTNILSVLEQPGKRSSVYFTHSDFNPAFYQFGLISGDIFIGDKIYFTSTPDFGFVIDITSGNVTIDTIPYGTFGDSFGELIIMPPTAQINNINVSTVAAFNPVIMEFQRGDFTGNTLRSTWNNTYVAFNAGAIFASFVEGDLVSVTTLSGYLGQFTILNKIGAVITINKTWSSFSPFFLSSETSGKLTSKSVQSRELYSSVDSLRPGIEPVDCKY